MPTSGKQQIFEQISNGDRKSTRFFTKSVVCNGNTMLI